MSTSRDSSTSQGQTFEHRVRTVLELAGYEVEHDCLLGGGQADLVAVKTIGPMVTRLLVECKYSQKNKSVGVDAVENFVSRILVLRTDDLIDAGMMVTNTGFTRYAKAVPQRSYIRLTTLEQLYSLIFDFRPYLSTLVDDFSTSKLEQTFVRPLMEPFEYAHVTSSDDRHMEKRENSRTQPIDIVKFCDGWITGEDSTRLCLLGEYGTGKTSFCQWYTAHLAKKCQANIDAGPIPLLIPLHKFTKAVDVDALVTDFLVNQCQIGNFRLQAFQFLLEHGRFLVMLDGFDEMARHVDREVRYQTIAELSKLARGCAKVILTGRPSYFPTDEELSEALSGSDQTNIYIAARNAYNELVEYELHTLRPFSDKQIRAFVRKSVPDEKRASKLLRYIEGRYDLYDLASRPVLLDMAVKSLPRLLEIQPETTVDAAKLYDIYTGLWIDREHAKGDFRKLIGKDDKLRFMEELGFQLFIEDKYYLSHRKLGEPIKTFFGIEDNEIDYFSHDIRTCSFLHRLPFQGYAFAHRSFQEFFVAKKLIRAVKLQESAPWGARHLPLEILRFTSELARGEDSKVQKQLVEWAQVGPEDIIGNNCISVALLSDFEIPKEVCHAFGIDGDTLRSYARFRIGDDSGGSAFAEYLSHTIVRLLGRQALKYGDVVVEPHEVLGDVIFNTYKVLRQFPLKTAAELQKYLSKASGSVVLRVARGRFRRLKKEVGFDDLVEEWKTQGFDRHVDELITTDVTPEDKVVLSQLWDLCMSELDESERELVQSYFIDQISLATIGEELGCHPNAVRAKLNRTLLRLRKALESKMK